MLRSRSQVQFPGLLVRPVSVAIPAGGNQTVLNFSASLVADEDDVDSETHRTRHQVLEEIVSADLSLSSSRLPLPVRVSGEGTSRFDPVNRLQSTGGFLRWHFSYDNDASILENLKRLASVWVRSELGGARFLLWSECGDVTPMFRWRLLMRR